MQIEYHKWFSPHLNRDMELKVYGHAGVPYIVFPCSQGRFFDYESFGMTNTLSGFINAGKIQLYAVDSVDNESWYNFLILPGDRNTRHEEYDQYIVDEVVPFVDSKKNTPSSGIMTTGCSMGAYHSVNFFLKHPNIFCGAIALSGLYRMDRNEFGLKDYDAPYVYFNSPVHYLANMNDPEQLALCRKGCVIVCTGQGAFEEEALQDTRDLDYSFKEKQIPAWIDYWGHDVNHDWPWWHRQIHYFMSCLHG